jgi:hypothetical protein
MDNKDALDMLLSDSCSTPSVEHEGFNEYHIELHCSCWVIVAKPGVSRHMEEREVFSYEIKTMHKVKS